MDDDAQGREPRNLLRFRKPSATGRGIYCPPLDIHSPIITRAVATVTADFLESQGPAAEGLAVGRAVHYLFGDDTSILVGEVETATITRMLDGDTSSLFLRLHR